MIGDDFLLGCNYWPRNKAMYWWADFDAGEVREEFAMIREIGLTHVRFFLLWENFQPSPTEISTQALADLRTVADIAQETGLKLQPTFFCGHMSGPNWCPDWMLSKEPRRSGDRQLVSTRRRADAAVRNFNVYTEPLMLDAETLLLRTVCKELADHPAIWAWSLGNEPDLFSVAPTPEIGRDWVKRCVAAIKAVDPRHPVLIGLHTASVGTKDGASLRVDQIAPVTDISVMHGYSIYDKLARRPLDPDYLAFIAGLTTTLAGRPILFEEFGVNTHLPDVAGDWRDAKMFDSTMRRLFFASEEDAGKFYAESLPRFAQMGCLGAFAWCFGDYHQRLWDRPCCDFQIHERFFGLFRADGTLKPSGKAIQNFARTKPKVQNAAKSVKLPVSADDFYADPRRFLASMYEEFGQLSA